MDIIERQLRSIIIGFIEPLTVEQKVKAGTVLESIVSELKESGISKGKRRYKILGLEDGVRVYQYVIRHPNDSYSKIEEHCGLGVDAINKNTKHVFHGKTLKEIVQMARQSISIDRFDSPCTIGEVAQMGISSRFSRD